jgi:hypothetical protein
MTNKMGQYPHRVTIDISLEEISTHNLWPFLFHRDIQDLVKEVLAIGDIPSQVLLEKYREASEVVLERGHPTMERILYPQYTQKYSCVLMHAIKEKYLDRIAECNVLDNVIDFHHIHSMARFLLEEDMLQEYEYLQNSKHGKFAGLQAVDTQ